MNQEEQSFLAAILADPKADTTRLVFADWLIEHGEPDRGEFIINQIALSKLGPPRREFIASADRFSFHRAEATTTVTLNKVQVHPVIGDRINIRLDYGVERVIPGESYRPKKKKPGYHDFFPGMLVTESLRVRRSILDDCFMTLKMDEHSVEWQGNELKKREEELLEKNYWGWLSSGGMSEYFATNKNGNRYGWLIKPSGEGGRLIEVLFRRGFVEVVSCEWDDWHNHNERIRSSCPIQEVSLTTIPTEQDIMDEFDKLNWMYVGVDMTRDGIVEALQGIWKGVKFFLRTTTEDILPR